MNITTRDFLKLSTASAFAGAGWCGQAAAKAPKVRLAAIGTGGRGHTDLGPVATSNYCAFILREVTRKKE